MRTPKKYTPEKAKLTPYEKTIEDAIDESANGPAPRASAAQLAAVRKAAGATLASIRGGKRAGAGRKPRAHIKTTVLLSPEVRERLNALAEEAGSLSAAAERAIMAAKITS